MTKKMLFAAMAVAVGQSRAVKLLLPVNQCRNIVVGTQQMTLSQLVAAAVNQLRQMDCARMA